MTSFSAGLRYGETKIRNLVLYPAELRARARFPAGFGSFCALSGQRLIGTERKQAAHRGTLESQFQAHADRSRLMHPSTRFALGSFIALVLLSVVLVIGFEGGW